jgi:hypothetical protein
MVFGVTGIDKSKKVIEKVWGFEKIQKAKFFCKRIMI